MKHRLIMQQHRLYISMRRLPDHYYQAFIWANRAVELGDVSQKGLVAMTVDRYLVSIGKKQLFGSQAFASDTTGDCFCLQQVEISFPDDRRREFTGHSLQERLARLESLNQGKNCPNKECELLLKPSPVGTVPGFW